MENFITELFKFVSRDDGGIRISKWDDVNLKRNLYYKKRKEVGVETYIHDILQVFYI
jgi:hypothetical protein